MGEKKIPSQQEIAKEINRFLSEKYGAHIQVEGFLGIPQIEKDNNNSNKKTEKKGGIENIKFDLKPEELRRYLDQYVIRQDKAKDVLATKICTHFNKIKYLSKRKGRFEDIGSIKNNIIMAGPTGVGKTFIVKLIARELGVPFVKADATKFSETGYVGGDVEDLVRDLVYQAEGDIELAQFGIVYIDEIDKLAASGYAGGLDVSRTGVQRGLLKIMEETEVELKTGFDPVSQLRALEEYRKTGKIEKKVINTKNILFVVSGAFNGLEGVIKKRLNRQGIGFGAEVSQNREELNYLQYLKSEDFISYGFESEFIGRLPVIAVLEPLNSRDLYQILKTVNSPIIVNKKLDFKSYGIDIQFEDVALQLLADRAYEGKIGARGLVSAIESVLIDFEKVFPSSNVKKFVITKDTVLTPKEELNKLLSNPNDERMLNRFDTILKEEKQSLKELIEERRAEYEEKFHDIFDSFTVEMVIELVYGDNLDVESAYRKILKIHRGIKEYEEIFQEAYDISISLDEEARLFLLTNLQEYNQDIVGLCEEHLKNFQYGLKLIKEKTGQDRFIITKEALEKPEKFLDDMIKKFYHR
ncbi:MAG: AAA family ATPase [bacterium]